MFQRVLNRSYCTVAQCRNEQHLVELRRRQVFVRVPVQTDSLALTATDAWRQTEAVRRIDIIGIRPTASAGP